MGRNEKRLLALFEEQSDELFRHCYFRILDRERSTAMVEHAFKRLWLYVSEISDRRDLGMLLYRIANDLIAQEGRIVSQSKPMPAVIRTDEERERVFLRMLRELEDAERDAFVLHHIDELPPEEIARMLELPVPVITERIQRGTERMETLLHPYA